MPKPAKVKSAAPADSAATVTAPDYPDGVEVTQWFSAADEPPVHIGVYDWRGPMMDGVHRYEWNGRTFGYWMNGNFVEVATDSDDQWRGIAREAVAETSRSHDDAPTQRPLENGAQAGRIDIGREQRQLAIDMARKTVEDNGLVLPEAVEEVNRQFVEGELTLEEHGEAVMAAVPHRQH